MRAPRLTRTLDAYLAVRLATAGAVARRELDRSARAHGRPLRELLLLIAVSDQHRSLTPTAAADRLGLQRSEVSRLVHELEDEGRIVMSESPYDRRAWVIEVPNREGVLAIGPGPLERVDRALRMRLTQLRQRQLTACLEQLKGPASPVADALTGF